MSQDDLGGPEIGKYMLQGLFRVCQNIAEWKWSKKRQHLVSKIMVFAFRPKRTKRLLGHFSLGQNLGNGWSKSIVLENKVVLHFDFNQVIWVTRSGFFFLAGYHAQGHNLNVFRTFSDTRYPKRLVSFKERAERGWKSGARSLSWKSGWKPSTIREFWHQRISGSFFRFRDTAIFWGPNEISNSKFLGVLNWKFHRHIIMILTAVVRCSARCSVRCSVRCS